MATEATAQAPIQPVEKPILCSPFEEPGEHWHFDRETMSMQKITGRRDAGYWYKTDQVGAAQRGLFADEQWDDLPLINLLRKDVRRWRESGYKGASTVTQELLRHWASKERLGWRLFFCQREAVETIIYLSELRIPGRTSRSKFKPALDDSDIQQLLRSERPSFYTTPTDFYPTLADKAADPALLPLRRLGCKMATGSGKTVVMAMLIAWAFCNRGINPNSDEFPNGVLVVCPNLTVKERLQVLRPEDPKNYYAEFDIVPTKYRPLLQMGKVMVTNWHWFSPRSEHEEGGKTYAVVNKGPDTPETYAKWVLGDLYDRLPIMVLNDEGHHCWRPAQANPERVSGEDKKALEEEAEEATVWVEGLDRLNNHNPRRPGKPGISVCVDLSATPFYIKGSGHPEGRPFPWLVSDFGLVDAIESGIVKIPRLPVMDTTGLPDPRYFKLWHKIREDLQRLGAANFFPGVAHKPKPEPVWREAEAALQQLAQQWKERFQYAREAKPGQEHVPPVMIVVCDNTDIAELFYQKISGETEIERVTPADVEEISDENGNSNGHGGRKARTATIYGESAVLPEFANTAARKHTIRIDSELLAKAESDDPKKGKRTPQKSFAKWWRRLESQDSRGNMFDVLFRWRC